MLAADCRATADPADDAFWYDTAADGGPAVVLHFFRTASCPHCKAAQPFVDALPGRLPWVRVASHPLTGNRPNAELYVRAARLLGQEANAVPGFMFCRRLETGFEAQETTGAELIAAIEACRAQRMGTASSGAGAAGEVKLPLIGTLDLQRWSLPVLTVVLAGLDAFNPGFQGEGCDNVPMKAVPTRTVGHNVHKRYCYGDLPDTRATGIACAIISPVSAAR